MGLIEVLLRYYQLLWYELILRKGLLEYSYLFMQ